jgi:hypothetical protein
MGCRAEFPAMPIENRLLHQWHYPPAVTLPVTREAPGEWQKALYIQPHVD